MESSLSITPPDIALPAQAQEALEELGLSINPQLFSWLVDMVMKYGVNPSGHMQVPPQKKGMPDEDYEKLCEVYTSRKKITVAGNIVGSGRAYMAQILREFYNKGLHGADQYLQHYGLLDNNSAKSHETALVEWALQFGMGKGTGRTIIWSVVKFFTTIPAMMQLAGIPKAEVDKTINNCLTEMVTAGDGTVWMPKLARNITKVVGQRPPGSKMPKEDVQLIWAAIKENSESEWKGEGDNRVKTATGQLMDKARKASASPPLMTKEQPQLMSMSEGGKEYSQFIVTVEAGSKSETMLINFLKNKSGQDWKWDTEPIAHNKNVGQAGAWAKIKIEDEEEYDED